MSDAQFKKKRIDVVFNIVQGGFDGSNNETITLTGHRVGCQIQNAGMETGVMCALRIEGMKLDQMNRLSVVQSSVVSQSMNTVTVMAGNDGDVLPVVFSGGIIEGFADFSGSPDIAFVVTAMSTARASAEPITSTSFNGPVSVATVMEAIAAKIGLGFVNNGVNVTLVGNVYYCGSAREQMQKCAEATRINYNIAMNRLVIWPKAITANTGEVADISSETGLLGYPSYSQGGVTLQCLFNPNIGLFSTIRLTSQYSPAAWVNNEGQLRSQSGAGAVYPPSNGLWVTQRVQHDIQTEAPGAPWLTTIEAARPEIAGQVAAFGR